MKNLSEGHVRLQCLIRAEGYLGSRLQPLPCSRPPPCTRGCPQRHAGSLSEREKVGRKGAGPRSKPWGPPLLSGPPSAMRQRCPAHSLTHAAQRGCRGPKTTNSQSCPSAGGPEVTAMRKESSVPPEGLHRTPTRPAKKTPHCHCKTKGPQEGVASGALCLWRKAKDRRHPPNPGVGGTRTQAGHAAGAQRIERPKSVWGSERQATCSVAGCSAPGLEGPANFTGCWGRLTPAQPALGTGQPHA